MDAKALLIMAGIGIVAGFLASLVAGGGSGIVTYLITGVLGAFVGGLVFDKLGISNKVANQIVTSTVGAIIVIIIARLVT